MKTKAYVALCAIAISAVACGTTTDTSTASTTVTSTTSTILAPSTSTTATPVSEPLDDAVPDNGANPFGGNDAEDGLMPDVICMNLQEAQNEIQDHGVYFSRSTDASGEGRRQVIDSNWVVVDQSPAPGANIGEGEAELFVLKEGETSVC